jgi:hypothetical protein
MFDTISRTGAVGAGATSRYGSGSDQMMRLLVAPAPQHCSVIQITDIEWNRRIYFHTGPILVVAVHKQIL